MNHSGHKINELIYIIMHCEQLEIHYRHFLLTLAR